MSNSELSNRFIEFFDYKITHIREELDSAESLQMTVEINDVCDSYFPEFSTVSEDDVY